TRNSKHSHRSNAWASRVWNFAFISVLGICLCFVICDLVLPHLARAASPTTKPSDKISILFTKLADRDPAVREQARIDLMGLSRSDLPAIRKYVQGRRPLAPAQATPPRDVASQIYLAGERYP